MRNYELTIISKQTSSIKDVFEEVEWLVKEARGELLSKVNDGVKCMAYPMDGETKGIYSYYKLKLNDEAVNDFSRKLYEMRSTIRHLLLTVERG